MALIRYQAFPGDANGDGAFNTSDLVQVFQSGHYEDDIEQNSDWTSGDWSGDLEFTSEDLVLAFRNGQYENGGAPAMTVPEPAVFRFC